MTAAWSVTERQIEPEWVLPKGSVLVSQNRMIVSACERVARLGLAAKESNRKTALQMRLSWIAL